MTAEAPERALAVPERRITLLPTGAAQALTDFKEFNRFIDDNMVYGVDYGAAYPGATGKPSLLKPGSEKLCNYYGLRPEQQRSPFSVERWDITDPFFNYEIMTDLCHIETGLYLVRGGLGSCNSLETKYRWRYRQRDCPGCGSIGTIRKGKEEYGGGWFCSRRDNGCGQNFPEGTHAIERQETGRVPNDAIFDQVNTILKMAKKRSLVDATLIATRASGLFTQDMEDMRASDDDTHRTPDDDDAAKGAAGTGRVAAPARPPAAPSAPRNRPRTPPSVSTHFWQLVHTIWPGLTAADSRDKANQWCRDLFDGKEFADLDAHRAAEALQALQEGHGLGEDPAAVLASEGQAKEEERDESELPL